MTARTIKTREQILDSIENLREDLYFSFGVPNPKGSACVPPQRDPRVHVDVDSPRKMSWSLHVMDALDNLQGAVYQREGTPKPKPTIPRLRKRHGKTSSPRND